MEAVTAFEQLYEAIHVMFLEHGALVDTGHWQAMKDMPQTKTIELQGIKADVQIAPDVPAWQEWISPNLPWAEDHFQERVYGLPLNPGEQYKNWPWYAGNVEAHQTVEEEKFSHTYMERFWPRRAGNPDRGDGFEGAEHYGIRYRYGDLTDVLTLLAREPTTRQAYLPIFFPEDTGAHHGERIPCTLGYHLMMRDNKLHCFYPMRSLDFLRYFRDDAYMAGRLVQWALERLQAWDQSQFEHGESPDMLLWDQVVPGTLSMYAHSLHVFEGDLPKLKREDPRR